MIRKLTTPRETVRSFAQELTQLIEKKTSKELSDLNYLQYKIK